MRVVGVFLLGLGMVLLPGSAIALLHAEGFSQVLGFLVCTALVPGPMILAGIALIRRVEDRWQSPGTAGGNRGWFDLNRLNWVGWSLVLATFGEGDRSGPPGEREP
jgi:hypothetical protein